jgi:hypothetical protein
MTEPIFDHGRLDVYRLSIEYVAFSYGLAKTLAGTNRHARDQWLRAAQSVPLNIAEGNGKPSGKVKDAAFSQFPHAQGGRDFMGYAMRTDGYRYVEWLDVLSGKVEAIELYNHLSDPDENENIAGQPEHARLPEQLSAELWSTLPRRSTPHPFSQSATAVSALGNRSELTWNPAGSRQPPASRPAGNAVAVTFSNSRDEVVELIWVGRDGSHRSYAKLKTGESFSIRTRPGAVWLALDANQNTLGHFVVQTSVDGRATATTP